MDTIPTKNLANTISTICEAPLSTGSLLKAAYARRGDGAWIFLMGIYFLGRDTVSSQPMEEIYNDFAFVSKPLNNLSIEQWLADLYDNGLVVSDKFPPIKVSNPNIEWNQEIIPSHHGKNQFPLRRFSQRISPDVYFQDSKLIAYAMKYRHSSVEYIKDFFGLEIFHGPSDARKGEFFIEIEDYRGKISLEEDRLLIKDRKEDLCIVGHINHREIILTNDQEQQIDTSAIDAIELWLTTTASEIVDYWSSTEFKYPYPINNHEREYIEHLKKTIYSGESESCEFKPYIDLQDKNKSFEILKSVCAFSNARGGYLFIGVTDEGEIVGLGKTIESRYRTDLDACIAAYIKDIQNFLRENLRDNQCFHVETFALYAINIVVIAVHKSTALNFTLNPPIAFVRRGATSSKMNPIEIQHAGNVDSM